MYVMPTIYIASLIDLLIFLSTFFDYTVYLVILLASSGYVLCLIDNSMAGFIFLKMHCYLDWLKLNSRITDLLLNYLESYQQSLMEI